MKLSKSILALILLTLISACKEKFNTHLWKEKGDLHSYPNRKKMVDDLIESRMLIGLSVSSVIDSLGKANAVYDNKMVYAIEVDYGSDIDPVSTKDLIVYLSNDSTVIKAEVVEERLH